MPDVKFVSGLAAAALTLALSMPAGAATGAQCKGLTKSACGATSACTWVDGYVRKDGRKVKAYCRKAGGKKGAGKVSKKSTKKSAKQSADKASKKYTKATKKASKKPVRPALKKAPKKAASKAGKITG